MIFHTNKPKNVSTQVSSAPVRIENMASGTQEQGKYLAWK